MISQKLLEIVKRHVNMTWCDADQEQQLIDMIEDAIDELDALSGIMNDYEAPGLARSLLLHRIDYDRAGALDDFSKNYRKDIIRFINRGRVKLNAPKNV